MVKYFHGWAFEEKLLVRRGLSSLDLRKNEEPAFLKSNQLELKKKVILWCFIARLTDDLLGEATVRRLCR